jgi:hypothetical protein
MECRTRRVVLSLHVKAQRRLVLGIAGGQALALLLVALAGTITTLSIGVRIALASASALAAVLIGLWGASTLTPPTVPQ